MEKQTVFIKRFPSKGELPNNHQFYTTDKGLFKYMDKEWWINNIGWYMEGVELPSEEEIDKSGDDFAYPHIDSAFAFNCFMHGANFILNKLKGENK